MMACYNPYSLAGKTILVTGASAGIGRATAIECSRLGAKVCITARNQVRLAETLTLLEGNGHCMWTVELTRQEDVNSMILDLPQIDGFVCNAGIMKRKPIDFIKSEDLYEIFEINTFVGFMLTKALMRSKKVNANASFVFVSSKAAIQTTAGNSMYAATKAAIASFARSCAIEYASKGIRANAVHPGMVETSGIDNMISLEEMEKDKQRYLLKRYGKPEEIAWTIAFLLSDASAWITGSSMIIDGGGRK